MSKRSLVDSIEVKKACSEDWDAMTGNARVRFCSHCELSVNNLSALTRKQAMRLVNESGGRICVRYVKNPVDNAPVFAGRLYQITRRASLAAGVLSASLTFSALALAQSQPSLNKVQSEISQRQNSIADELKSRTTRLSGLITDLNGAVVPAMPVTITNLKTDASQTTKSNDEGTYQFENVSAGKYKISVPEQRGFKLREMEIEVSENRENVADLSLETSELTVTVGELAVIGYSTPLFTAVAGGEIEEVGNLLVRGARVNARDENYSRITPLFLAVENGSAEITETLLNFGARINARDDLRQTPLMRLDEDASVELVNLLIKHGARVNLLDKEKNTALIFAARSVKAEVLEILINHSADIDARNGAGRTALMEAADADNFENVRALLLAGADAGLKDEDGETAFDLTTNEEIKRLLESYGAPTFRPDSN